MLIVKVGAIEYIVYYINCNSGRGIESALLEKNKGEDDEDDQVDIFNMIQKKKKYQCSPESR